MTVEFEDAGATSQSGRGMTGVLVGLDAVTRAELSRYVPALSDDPERVAIGVFQGEQRTGGYAIRVDRIVRDGDVLTVHARFTAPGPSDIVTMALTSPAHIVVVARSDVEGVETVILVDQSGAERARTESR